MSRGDQDRLVKLALLFILNLAWVVFPVAATPALDSPLPTPDSPLPTATAPASCVEQMAALGWRCYPAEPPEYVCYRGVYGLLPPACVTDRGSVCAHHWCGPDPPAEPAQQTAVAGSSSTPEPELLGAVQLPPPVAIPDAPQLHPPPAPTPPRLPTIERAGRAYVKWSKAAP